MLAEYHSLNLRDNFYSYYIDGLEQVRPLGLYQVRQLTIKSLLSGIRNFYISVGISKKQNEIFKCHSVCSDKGGENLEVARAMSICAYRMIIPCLN